MPQDLGARLVSAGLLTREKLADALSSADPLPWALVEQGIVASAIANLLRSDGFEMVERPALKAAAGDPNLHKRLRPEIAHSLLALPVGVTEHGLAVAFADPSDVHATREVGLATGGVIVPRVAPVDALREAIMRAYPDYVPPRQSETPFELRPKRVIPTTLPGTEPVPLTRPARKSNPDVDTAQTPRAAPSGHPGANAAPDVDVANAVDEGSMENGRQSFVRSAPAGAASNGASAPPAAPSDGAEADSDEPVLLLQAKTFPTPIELTRPRSEPAPRNSVQPRSAFDDSVEVVLDDSWTSLDEEPEVAPETDATDKYRASLTSPPAAPARRSTGRASRPSIVPPSDIGTTLATMRASQDRDAILRMACEGALTVGRSAVLLALRKGVLRGWEGIGGGITADAVQNLWIPATSPSMFRKVLRSGEIHVGPYGTNAADSLFRAATGSRSGRVVVVPVEVGGKAVALLVADDVRYGDAGVERIEVLASAVGRALKRIIVSRRG